MSQDYADPGVVVNVANWVGRDDLAHKPVCEVDVARQVWEIVGGGGPVGNVTADAIYRHIGAQVRSIRKRRGRTQGALASHANLTRTSLSNIEAGRQRVTIHALLEMAAALDVAPATLLPDLRTIPSADIDLLVERGALPEEAEALARLLRA